jgi:phage terminase small subunit
VINKQGYVIAKEVTGRDGTVTVTTIANPLWHDLEDLLVKMSKLLSDMGMTPYSAKVTSLDFKGNLSPGNSTAASGPPKVNLPVPSLT